MSKPYNSYKTANQNRTGFFIKELLEDYNTYGMDIDCIYYDKVKKRYIIIEFLHCDSKHPFESHPHYYPFNYKKFCSLWEIAKELGAELWLVNFSVLDEYKDNVRLLKINGIDYNKVDYYKNQKIKPKRLDYLNIFSDTKMSFDEFKKIFRQLNFNAK